MQRPRAVDGDVDASSNPMAVHHAAAPAPRRGHEHLRQHFALRPSASAAAASAIAADARNALPGAAYQSWVEFRSFRDLPACPLPRVSCSTERGFLHATSGGGVRAWFTAATTPAVVIHLRPPGCISVGSAARVWRNAPPNGGTLPRTVSLDLASLPFRGDSLMHDFFAFAEMITTARRLNVILLAAEAGMWALKRAVRDALGLRGDDSDCALYVWSEGVPTTLAPQHFATRDQFPSTLYYGRRTPFLTPWQERGQSGMICEMAWKEAVTCVVSGRVPMTTSNAIKLAALQLFIGRLTKLSNNPILATEFDVSADDDDDDSNDGGYGNDAASSSEEDYDVNHDGVNHEETAADWKELYFDEPLDHGGLGLLHRLRVSATIARPLHFDVIEFPKLLKSILPTSVRKMFRGSSARAYLALKRALQHELAILAHEAFIAAPASLVDDASSKLKLIDTSTRGREELIATTLEAKHTTLTSYLYSVVRNEQKRYVVLARFIAPLGFHSSIDSIGATFINVRIDLTPSQQTEQRDDDTAADSVVRSHFLPRRPGADAAPTEKVSAEQHISLCVLALSTDGISLSIDEAAGEEEIIHEDDDEGCCTVRELGPTELEISSAITCLPFEDIARWIIEGNSIHIETRNDFTSSLLLRYTLIFDDDEVAAAAGHLLTCFAERTVDGISLGGRERLWRLAS